jgi:hypothetical protein
MACWPAAIPSSSRCLGGSRLRRSVGVGPSRFSLPSGLIGQARLLCKQVLARATAAPKNSAHTASDLMPVIFFILDTPSRRRTQVWGRSGGQEARGCRHRSRLARSRPRATKPETARFGIWCSQRSSLPCPVNDAVNVLPCATVSTRDEPVNLSDSCPDTHQHCSPADANCCQSLLLDPNAMIGMDLHKRLFLLVTGLQLDIRIATVN